jgi:hypothetical protein
MDFLHDLRSRVIGQPMSDREATDFAYLRNDTGLLSDVADDWNRLRRHGAGTWGAPLKLASAFGARLQSAPSAAPPSRASKCLSTAGRLTPRRRDRPCRRPKDVASIEIEPDRTMLYCCERGSRFVLACRLY